MSEALPERRLAAIVSADVVGYSRLMGEDETGTLERLKVHRKTLIEPAITKWHGRIVKLMGDGILIEFASAVDAVSCSVEVQRAMTEHNRNIPEAQRIVFRVGINLGDIIIEDDDIYGDGVNIAARIEALAEPGGICLSGTAYDQVHNKLELGLQAMGKQMLKNIAEPVRVYRVLLNADGANAAGAPSRLPAGRAGAHRVSRQSSRRAMLIAAAAAVVLVGGAAAWLRYPVALPWLGVTGSAVFDPRRIAVLPFANYSSESEQDYFADGITEELIARLAQIEALAVIARTSVMGYKNTEKTIDDIGRELRVGMVLEGSVRKAADQLRITVQLIDVGTQEHLWAANYDRQLDDVFAIQKDVADQVAAALGKRSLHNGVPKAPADPAAYDAYLRGRYFWHQRSKTSMLKSVDYFNAAIAADPTYARGYAGLAGAYLILGWFKMLPPKETYAKARAAAETAIKLDPAHAEAHAALAVVMMNAEHDWAAAERQFETAIELDPNAVHPHHWYAIYHLFRGNYDAGVREMDIALALDPLSVIINVNRGRLLWYSGRNEEALAQFQAALEMRPELWFIHSVLADFYLAAGDPDAAMAAAERGRPYSNESCDIDAFNIRALAGADRMDEARAALEALLGRAESEFVSPHCLAMAYIPFPEHRDKFYAFAERDLENGGDFVFYFKLYDESFQNDPRHQELLRKAGLE